MKRRLGLLLARSRRGLRIGSAVIDPATGEVRRGSEVCRLEPRTLEVLRLLAEQPGEVVSKDRILDSVWPEVTVTEASVWRTISDLRRVLDVDGVPSVIENLPRRGYRLRAEAATVGPSTERRGARRWVGGLLVAAAVVVLVVVAVIWRGAPATHSEDSISAQLDQAEKVYAVRSAASTEQVIELTREALDLDPNNARAHRLLADALQLKGSRFSSDPRWLRAALRSSQRAVELAPASSEAHTTRGRCLRVRGEKARAVESYRRALDLDPANVAAANNLALLLFDSGDLGGATALFLDLTRRVPEDPELWHNLGVVRLHSDRISIAREAFERTIALDPDFVVAHANLGLVEILTGEIAAARRRLDGVLQRRPRDHSCRLVAAQLEIAAGDLDKADEHLAVLTDSVIAKPSHRGHLLAAEIARRRGDTEGARAVTEWLRRPLSPAEVAAEEDVVSKYVLAAAAAIDGDRAAAFQWLGRALDSGLRGRALLDADPLFITLRRDPGFDRLLARASG